MSEPGDAEVRHREAWQGRERLRAGDHKPRGPRCGFCQLDGCPDCDPGFAPRSDT